MNNIPFLIWANSQKLWSHSSFYLNNQGKKTQAIKAKLPRKPYINLHDFIEILEKEAKRSKKDLPNDEFLKGYLFALNSVTRKLNNIEENEAGR